jgi:hypothetical protein
VGSASTQQFQLRRAYGEVQKQNNPLQTAYFVRAQRSGTKRISDWRELTGMREQQRGKTQKAPIAKKRFQIPQINIARPTTLRSGACSMLNGIIAWQKSCDALRPFSSEQNAATKTRWRDERTQRAGGYYRTRRSVGKIRAARIIGGVVGEKRQWCARQFGGTTASRASCRSVGRRSISPMPEGPFCDARLDFHFYEFVQKLDHVLAQICTIIQARQFKGLKRSLGTGGEIFEHRLRRFHSDLSPTAQRISPDAGGEVQGTVDA